MQLNAFPGISSMNSPAAQQLGARQDAFAGVLARAQRSTSGGESDRRQAAEEFVAVAFIQPILKQLRESNNAAEPFAPGPAEKQFGSIMDAAVSKQIVTASNFALVDRIAQDLSGRKAAWPSPVPPGTHAAASASSSSPAAVTGESSNIGDAP